VCRQKPILEAAYRHCTAVTGAEAAAAAAVGAVPLPCASDELALIVMRARFWFDWAQSSTCAVGAQSDEQEKD
jgi:hypothetical protein